MLSGLRFWSQPGLWTHTSTHLSICPSTLPPTYPSVYPSTHPRTRLSIHPPTHPPIRQSIHPPTHPSPHPPDWGHNLVGWPFGGGIVMGSCGCDRTVAGVPGVGREGSQSPPAILQVVHCAHELLVPLLGSGQFSAVRDSPAQSWTQWVLILGSQLTAVQRSGCSWDGTGALQAVGTREGAVKRPRLPTPGSDWSQQDGRAP